MSFNWWFYILKCVFLYLTVLVSFVGFIFYVVAMLWAAHCVF
jgi:hypothetical protein